MIAWLGLMLAAAAAGLAASGAASLLAWVSVPAARLLPPTRRADALLALASLPALAAMGAAAAVAAPSVLHALQIRPDHCAHHGHHSHLCAVHGALPPAWLAAVGAIAVAILVARTFIAADKLRRTTARIAGLEALGDSEGADIVWVPGSPWLCLAIGLRRPRVLASRSLPHHLGPTRWRAALAHERAHLRRADPATTVALAALQVWLWPGFGRAVVDGWREAAEQAADAGAAAETSALDVAEALVAVARLRPDTSLQPALAAVALERRIARLLDGPADRGSARPVAVVVGLALVAVLVGALTLDPAHHGIESSLSLVDTYYHR